jgi:putative ABC transport system permease protein
VTRFALRGLLSRKLRTALTALAIVLGVAMISGTFVLTDSIDNAFDRIFTDIRKGSNAVISGKSAFDLTEGSGVAEPTFDEGLLADVRALPGVAEAEGSVDSETTQLIDEDGKVIQFGLGGAPNLGFSIADPQSRFNPLSLVSGSWPGPGEVVIDKETVDKKDLEVGREIGVQVEGPVERFRISGVIQFSSGLTIGGATLAGFDLPTAQQVFEKEGRLDEIAVAAKPDVTDPELVGQIREILPAGTQVRGVGEQVQADAEETNEFISFLRIFLLAFGGIALFVGSFVIANSLSITIAQRTRELATLRMLGASRRQVLRSIIVEALVVGVLASVIGLFVGLLLAKSLFWVFDVFGFTLPNTGLVFLTRTAVIVALLAGIVVTFVASLRPAIRATRVPPIAAVREGATLPRGRFARFRAVGAALLAGAGFAALAYGIFRSGLGTTQVLLWMGLGTLLVFMGVALFSSRLVRPLAAGTSRIAPWVVFAFSVVAWPFFSLPYALVFHAFARSSAVVTRVVALVGGFLLPGLMVDLLVFLAAWWLGHTDARLALAGPVVALVLIALALYAALRDDRAEEPQRPGETPDLLPDSTATKIGSANARQNPQRTASTAAALMIGLTLVTLVATLAAGIIASFRGAVNDLFVGDYAITAQNNFSPIPVDAAGATAKVSGVTAIGNVRTGETLVFGEPHFSTAVDPGMAEVIDMDWKEGSQDVFSTLGEDGAFVDDAYAEDHDLRLGSPIKVTFPNGKTRQFAIEGIFDPPTGGSPFGTVTISTTTWDSEVPQPKNLYSFLEMRGGTTDANQAALESALADFPNAKVQTRKKFIDNQIAPLGQILNILYVLLALSVVVSLFGIVNTLVLTVFERTREIGMLRAIGMTRRQVRRMIRHESVITALIGATIGIVLGIVLAALLIARVDFIVFSFPTAQVIVFVLAAIVVGIVAAVFPARRAARLDPLQAIAYE